MFGFFRKSSKKEKLEAAHRGGRSDFNNEDYSGADLTGLKLEGCKFVNCNFEGAVFHDVKISRVAMLHCNLQRAAFSKAEIFQCYFDNSDLFNAKFEESILHYLDFDDAFLGSARFSSVVFLGVSFLKAILFNAKFHKSPFALCEFDGVVFPRGSDEQSTTLPNSVDFESVSETANMYAGRSKIVEENSRVSRLFGSISGMKQLCSTFAEHGSAYFTILNEGCRKGLSPLKIFISYADEDREFVNTFQSKLERRGCAAWFAPRNMEPGRTIEQQLVEAVERANAFILVLSPHSIASDWVGREIRYGGARAKAGQLAFFPIRVAPYDQISKLPSVGPLSTGDLSSDLSAYFIPDFSNWREKDLFNRSGSDGFETALDNLVVEMRKKVGDDHKIVS